LKELRRKIIDEDKEIESEGFYEWEIENWDNLSDKEFSPIFNIADRKW